MEPFATALLAVAAIGIPLVILLLNGQGKKRGCGRGCATCGNRFLCHPGQYAPEQKEDPGDPEGKEEKNGA